MYKVVYNTCFGGFNISKKAVEWLKENARDEVKEFICDKLKKYEAEAETYEKDPLISLMSPIEYVGADLKYFLPRHDRDLVSCVEALGDKASGFCASLAIKELKGSAYRIEEYDGSETIYEPEDEEYVHIEE